MNRNIRCLIVDDEPIAREGLARYISRTDWLENIGECEDALQLNSLLKSGESVDLIFLDIEMPFISGLDYIATLVDPPMVIITTAYGEYALKGYELDVIDYLLKPVSFPRFLKAVTKARDFFNCHTGVRNRDFMFLRADRKLHKVRFADILYIEAVENYVKVITADSVIVTRTPLHSLLADLPASGFLRIHKSYVVNMDHVTCVEGNMLILPGATIQVSRSYRATLDAWIEGC